MKRHSGEKMENDGRPKTKSGTLANFWKWTLVKMERDGVPLYMECEKAKSI